VRRDKVPDLTIAWLVAVARNKLVDHWRRKGREEAKLALIEDDDRIDEWDVQLDIIRAHEVLAALGAHHRSALTLRYLDGLPVRQVAELLDRTEHATEALLVRARVAFRRAYGEEEIHV
jgi:RNA polymerase sigma-70 factor (ECF subfamily)